MRNESDELKRQQLIFASRSLACGVLDAQGEPCVVFQGDIVLNPGREWDRTSIARETRDSSTKSICERTVQHLRSTEEFKVDKLNFIVTNNKRFGLNVRIEVKIEPDKEVVVSNVLEDYNNICYLQQLKQLKFVI